MKLSWLKKITKYLFKFSLVGIFITILGLSIITFCLTILSTSLIPTYIFVYTINIGISYLCNTFFTYKKSIQLKDILRYYAVYCSSMILGVFLLFFYKNIFSFPDFVYPFFVTPFTMLFNFFFVTKILKPKLF